MTSAAALTYDSLVNDIKTYADRTDQPFLDQIPRFIMLGENKIASECRGLGLLQVAEFTLNEAVIQKPARCREIASISFVDPTTGERAYLKKRSYEYCRTYSPDSTVLGTPKYYADYDYEHALVVPTPQAAAQAEIIYYERPEPLSSENQTNWSTRYAPQLLFWACMIPTAPFLKRADRIAEFTNFYNEAKAALENESSRRTIDRAALRSGE